MAKFKVRGGVHAHPSVIKAGCSAIGLWAVVGSWCAGHGADGWVPAQVVEDFDPVYPATAETLVAARLWESETRDGEPGWAFRGEGDVYAWELRDPDRRTPIPLGLRQRVYERDGYRCRTCGSGDDLTLDHIHPWSLGGEDTEANLQTLCGPCNSRKGARV